MTSNETSESPLRQLHTRVPGPGASPQRPELTGTPGSGEGFAFLRR